MVSLAVEEHQSKVRDRGVGISQVQSKWESDNSHFNFEFESLALSSWLHAIKKQTALRKSKEDGENKIWNESVFTSWEPGSDLEGNLLKDFEDLA